MSSLVRPAAALLLAIACAGPRPVGTDTIVLRGVSFQPPQTWTLMWEPDSVAVIAPPDDETSALRISVLVAVGANAQAIQAAYADTQVTTSDTIVFEAGQRVSIRFWQTARISAPDTLRTAIVSMAQATSLGSSVVAIRLAAADAMVRSIAFPR